MGSPKMDPMPDTETVNADPAELAKFSELAHRWWDPDSEFRPLHQINPMRLEWIASQMPLAGKRVLDVGCGGGILADSMARRGANVLGIDLASKPLKVAQLHALEAGTPNVEYREISVEALAQEPGIVFAYPARRVYNATTAGGKLAGVDEAMGGSPGR